jgi:thioredoxin reductase (NADPH)
LDLATVAAREMSTSTRGSATSSTSGGRLIVRATWGIRIVGERWSPRAHEIRDLLSRRNVRFEFVAVDSEEGQQLLDQFHLDRARLPVIMAFSGLWENPSNSEIFEAFGLPARPPAARYDVTILGGGPAGLAAAVYGASEGLRTLVLERDSVGGQASSSSSIRNYLGFARGISGGELAIGAFQQARMFGAGRTNIILEAHQGPHQLCPAASPMTTVQGRMVQEVTKPLRT